MERALLEVRRLGFDGLVAVLDRDTAPAGDRLDQAKAGVERDRSDLHRVPVPTALGEANPHFEAWLSDDGDAVRSVLKISAEEAVPGVADGSPKVTLERLVADRGMDRDETKAAVAAAVDVVRCRSAGDTGLAEFVAELRREFGIE